MHAHSFATVNFVPPFAAPQTTQKHHHYPRSSSRRDAAKARGTVISGVHRRGQNGNVKRTMMMRTSKPLRRHSHQSKVDNDDDDDDDEMKKKKTVLVEKTATTDTRRRERRTENAWDIERAAMGPRDENATGTAPGQPLMTKYTSLFHHRHHIYIYI
jgi:hypothetical protein